MAYRTVLVHMNDARRMVTAVTHAVQIARVFDARLVGLYVYPAGEPAATEAGTAAAEGPREEADRLGAIFRDLTEKERFVADWRALPFEGTDPARIVVARSRAADLVIANQPDPDWEHSRLLDFPGRLAIESGRPVIVVPKGSGAAALPKSVVIAWNASREAARAAFDALPLLKGAQKVELLTIHEAGERTLLQPGEDVLPVSAVADALSRHTVKPTVTNLKATGDSVGEQICARALAQDADLLVMGAYGLTRLRELVFGGVSRHVLARAPVPVLLSH
jgi:nucleotide-binding universal stress UspA family protein